MDKSTKAEVKGLAKTYLRVLAILIFAAIGAILYAASEDGGGSWAAILFLGAALFLYFQPHLKARKARAKAEASGAGPEPTGDA